MSSLRIVFVVGSIAKFLKALMRVLERNREEDGENESCSRNEELYSLSSLQNLIGATK
jgi:hypothetical protein